MASERLHAASILDAALGAAVLRRVCDPVLPRLRRLCSPGPFESGSHSSPPRSGLQPLRDSALQRQASLGSFSTENAFVKLGLFRCGLHWGPAARVELGRGLLSVLPREEPA
ncbi:unnamed protein product, partial [Polarella glacialis]